MGTVCHFLSFVMISRIVFENIFFVENFKDNFRDNFEDNFGTNFKNNSEVNFGNKFYLLFW